MHQFVVNMKSMPSLHSGTLKRAVRTKRIPPSLRGQKRHVCTLFHSGGICQRGLRYPASTHMAEARAKSKHLNAFCILRLWTSANPHATLLCVIVENEPANNGYSMLINYATDIRAKAVVVLPSHPIATQFGVFNCRPCMCSTNGNRRKWSIPLTQKLPGSR
uniref:Ribosomal protein L2 n=1 Tax=Ditylenchus dipsaci TaxID=166011 RepID=A0A915ED84_9BILA